MQIVKTKKVKNLRLIMTKVKILLINIRSNSIITKHAIPTSILN